MTRDTGPPDGVRISIYIGADLVKHIDEAAYAARTSRSKFIADVLSKATKFKPSGGGKDKAVSGM